MRVCNLRQRIVVAQDPFAIGRVAHQVAHIDLSGVLRDVRNTAQPRPRQLSKIIDQPPSPAHERDTLDLLATAQEAHLIQSLCQTLCGLRRW
jgi:hypothetical protein